MDLELDRVVLAHKPGIQRSEAHEWGADTSSILGLVQLSNFRFKAHSVSTQELTTEGEHGWLWYFPKEGSLGVSTLGVTTSSTALVSTYPQQRTLAHLVAL